MTQPKLTKTHRWPPDLFARVETLAKSQGRPVQHVLDECVEIGIRVKEAGNMYRSDSLWLVQEGTAQLLSEVGQLPDRERYGYDWVVVEATDETDAVHQANLLDEGQHPAQVEMDLFAAAYRAGAVDLPDRC